MKIVITGSGGRLGAALFRQYGKQFTVTGFSHADLDLSDFSKLRQALGHLDFNLLINAAAFTNVDLAEKEPDQAFRVNAEAPGVLAEICSEKGARLVHISTDYVFAGDKNDPYTEEDSPKPISAYGESKLAGETAVLQVNDKHLVVRVSWVFGPDRPSFIDQIIARARENDRVSAVADKLSTPTYTRDIADMLLRVVGAAGLLHIANSGQASWQEYAQHALDCCVEAGLPLKARKVEPLKMADMQNWVARRPPYTVLGTGKYEQITGAKPRHWQDAVGEYVRELAGRQGAAASQPPISP